MQSAVPITPIPSSPGVYYEYVGKIQFATKWRKYRMQLNYLKMDHNSTELSDYILEVLAKCPGTERVCQKQLVLETEIPKYLHMADRLLMKLQKLAPESNPAIIQNLTPFGPTNGSNHEEATRLIDLELGPQEDKMRQDRENLKIMQKDAVKYLQTYPANTPEQFFRTIKEWFRAMQNLLIQHVESYRRLIKILEQANIGKISHLLLSPEELKRIIEDLNNQHYNEEVPDIDPLFSEFRKLVTISSFRHRYLVNLEVTFPLFPKTEFLLFKTYPVMTIQKNGLGVRKSHGYWGSK